MNLIRLTKCVIAVLALSAIPVALLAQCPDRPASGTEVKDPYTVTPSNGVLMADMSLGQSVDQAGYTHYCYQYLSPNGVVEAPTLRVNPGDTLQLNVANVIQDSEASKMKMHHAAGGPVCGDGGTATVSSTNVHFHGMPVQPVCHQDDVINTLIQPGSSPFNYDIPIPADTPPGLYWYHPHVHGFTEFQVNGGAAGALVVNGMEKVRPEVAGLKDRVFVIRQQYLVPWIPGPYQLSLNYEVSLFPKAPAPYINIGPGERQFWRVANATLQDFIPLQILINNKPEKLELIALDGYPLAKTRNVDTILIPPAGRAEFIVTGPAVGQTGQFEVGPYDTGPTGNPDISALLAVINPVSNGPVPDSRTAASAASASTAPKLKWSDLENVKATKERKLFFSEEFGGTNGPIQFYITVDGQQQKVFDPNEKPVIRTKVGEVEDWTIENRALETHAFHIHQIHFKVLEVDGKTVPVHDMLDTVTIPYWEGPGTPYHSVKVRMDFRDPNIAGTFLFHCHILLHEDLGMMHKIQVDP
ncbi:MAG TPA: multicopper oxidase domain-containing protein [Terriglobales bacterium]|nr:multicopper oxidase domain-containing protein [Terriglobales bacterium]